MKFSIITPAYIYDQNRATLFKECIESINRQDFDHSDFEHVIINDGSIFPFDTPSYTHIKLINQSNLQRLTAYNTGLEAAKGDYILFLDSDDEFTPQTLSSVERGFASNRRYKMLNFGCTFIHRDGAQSDRDPFMPKEEKIGHEIFGGGKIVNGTFVFHKSVYKDLGGFMPAVVRDIDCTQVAYPPYRGAPEPYIRDLHATSPYDFSAWAQLKYPEIQQFFMTKHPDHPKGLVRELGNPWGQDYFLFYVYTRKYKSKPIMENLLRVHLK